MEYHVNIEENLLPYIINGDNSGLEDAEIEAVDAYFADLKNFVVSYEDTSDFGRCDILNKLGSVVPCIITEF